jgi:hypothetical protein
MAAGDASKRNNKESRMQQIELKDGRTVTIDIDTSSLSPIQTLMIISAAVDVLVRSGRIRDDVAINGPQLLQFLDELGDELAATQSAD